MHDDTGNDGHPTSSDLVELDEARWDNTQYHMRVQDQLIEAIDAKIHHDSVMVERQRDLQKEIMLSHLLRLLSRRFTPSRHLIYTLEMCASRTLSRLFVPACRAKEEEDFMREVLVLSEQHQAASL